MLAERPPEDQLEMEVRELTSLLRDGGSCARLRGVLASRGLLASETILAGLIEDENEGMYGALITPDQQCIVFELNRDNSMTRWEAVRDLSVLEDAFGAVGTGMAMLRDGQISLSQPVHDEWDS
jgi:hypothetical protein